MKGAKEGDEQTQTHVYIKIHFSLDTVTSDDVQAMLYFMWLCDLVIGEQTLPYVEQVVWVTQYDGRLALSGADIQYVCGLYYWTDGL